MIKVKSKKVVTMHLDFDLYSKLDTIAKQQYRSKQSILKEIIGKLR